MALPTVTDCKTYLRIQTTGDDTMLTAALAQATADVQQFVGPIASAEVVMTDEAEALGKRVITLFCSVRPLAIASVVIEDADGTEVDADTYRVDGVTGVIRAVKGHWFDNGPYTITADAGWAEHPQYDDLIEPVLSSAILDLVAERYQHRNPLSVGESDTGVSRSYADRSMPLRVRRALLNLRPVGFGAP